MRAVVVRGVDDVAIETVEDARVEVPTDIPMRVTSSAICGTDLHIYEGRMGRDNDERYPDIPRNVAGYNLPQLLPEHGFHVARALVGSEATCVTILEAKVRVVDSPPVRGLVVLGYSDAYRAADHVPQILQYGPIGLEGFDRRLVEDERKKGGFDGSWALLMMLFEREVCTIGVKPRTLVSTYDGVHQLGSQNGRPALYYPDYGIQQRSPATKRGVASCEN